MAATDYVSHGTLPPVIFWSCCAMSWAAKACSWWGHKPSRLKGAPPCGDFPAVPEYRKCAGAGENRGKKHTHKCSPLPKLAQQYMPYPVLKSDHCCFNWQC